MKLPQKVLWVASPLSRAVQTMLLACPQPQLLAASCMASTSNTASGGCRTVVKPELSEHLMTTGDVGIPASQLAAKFPQASPHPFFGLTSPLLPILLACISKNLSLILLSHRLQSFHLNSNKGPTAIHQEYIVAMM